MKLNLNILNVSFYLILTGIFFLPFNSWNGISNLGEYYRDSCVLFFLLAFFILLFKKKIKLPLHSPIFYSLIVFLVWAAATTGKQPRHLPIRQAMFLPQATNPVTKKNIQWRTMQTRPTCPQKSSQLSMEMAIVF